MAVGGSNAALADVVFGNLGASGTTGALSNISAAITGTEKMAQVFTTSSGTNERLSSITLGAFSSVGATLALEVFNSNGSAPGTSFATSTNTNTLGTNTNGALVTWSFNNVLMQPNTSYWIVPSSGLSWNFRDNFAAPTPQNSSGYAYVSSYSSSNGGATWGSIGSQPLTVSVTAVPEPSTYALAAIGFGVAGFARWRRRASRSGR